ncbi:hypothetical protein, partial [Ilumatobacter sp.]|uniref:hypothetical protein n=1 Tax=Ilumatobacter sp. TaxID=1967498 RepID=UPI003C5DC468
ASIVASPSATLLGGYNDDLVVAPRDGRPVVVDTADFGLDDPPFGPRVRPIGWLDTPEGGDLFLVSAYDVEAGVEREYTVDVSGAVAPSPGPVPATYEARVEARGHHIVNDAGGVYFLENDGTATRISSGTAVAASETQILLRECNDERQCHYALQPIDGGESAPTGILPAEVVAGAYGLSLSPDGTAVSYTSYGLTNERVIVDFVDGPVATTPSSDYATTGAWAPDGSGEFVVAEASNGTEGLVFLDRVSGDAVPFGEQLGQVMGIAIRYPDSELEPSTFVEPTSIEFSTADGVPTDLRLVAFSGLGEMTLLDLDAATAASWPTQPLPGPAQSQLFSDGDRVGGYTDSNGGTGFVSEFGGVTTTLQGDNVPTGPLYPGPDGGFWERNVDEPGSEGIDYTVVNLDGGPPRGGSPAAASNVHELRIANGTLLDGDGRGGLVFSSGGDLYTSAGGGVDRLTSGELLAIGTTTALVRECDERLNCAAFVVDRETGERTDSGLDPLAFATGASTDRAVSLIGSMSPDGRVALINFASTGTASDPPEPVDKWFFFDLETGNPVGAQQPDDGQPIVWNTAGTYAAYVAGDEVVVYEHSTGRFLTVPGTDGTRSLTQVDPAFS